MTRNEFMTALRKRLSHLPAEEQDAALKYYEEYFDEAESEEEAARQLGSPDAIADRILADYGAGNAASADFSPRALRCWRCSSCSCAPAFRPLPVLRRRGRFCWAWRSSAGAWACSAASSPDTCAIGPAC